MIGIDPKTGRTVTGLQALACRFERILTTQVSSRIKRRGVGNRAIAYLGKLQDPTTAMIVQNLTLEALASPVNGLQSFKASQCRAVPTGKGFRVEVTGHWQGQPFTLKGGL
ncbi:phage baseplate protein [Photobacterium sp. TLY01]|uniref:phage baseplate protein n=1 Tax=Photobacterium sp. TLY01 TaxID=2907534 RepID=UPI001F212FBD|nr:phage baseplate protein [Photobacterium sp. TLY01]UIP28890.1 phage baseplate protein [Photobacterium sp. TLY01]